MLEAIKAMQYEGTKSEIIQGFKEQGNEAVRAKRWADGKEFYTNGIAILNAKTQGDVKWDDPPAGEEEAEEERLKGLRETVYVNRALCQLELKNYRSATLDCAEALKINERNVKALYRSGLALLALEKIREAWDVVYRGTRVDEGNVPMQKLLEKIKEKERAIEERERKRRAEVERKERKIVVLKTALQARNIRLRGSERPPDLQDAVIRLSPDPLSPKSLLEFPVMFLYPLHNQTDLVKAWAEKDAVWQHLSYILPLPWDEKGEYKEVDCFMDTVSGGLMKVGKKLSLLELLSNGKTEVVDGLVRIYVVPTARAKEWIEDVKAAKGK
jgi:tetratricopeptide (TPR) repeat protein